MNKRNIFKFIFYFYQKGRFLCDLSSFLPVFSRVYGKICVKIRLIWLLRKGGKIFPRGAAKSFVKGTVEATHRAKAALKGALGDA